MKKTLKEETVLFISVTKWIILSTFIGIIVGAATAVFLKLLSGGIAWNRGNALFYLSLPAALFLSAFLIKYLAPDAKGHGTEKVIEAVHKYSGRIKPAVIPVKLLATVITIAGGGSAGKEGPAAQIGAGLSSLFADIFRFDDTDRKKLVICGISAGFAAVFGTPVAGAIFGIEVLFIGGMLYNVLLPSFIAGIASYYTATSLGIEYLYHPMDFSVNILNIMDGRLFIKVLISGFFFGLCSLLFIETMNFFKRLSDKIKMYEPFKAAAGGIILVMLALLFSKRYLGLGLDTIESALSGVRIVWYAFLLKILFTAVTLSFGGSGGVVTPIFFIGSTAGIAFAGIASADPGFFASLGFVALLAGAANAPISAMIMAVELFGSGVILYAGIACVISFFITGHRSIYPSQVIRIKKSTSIDVVTGQDVENLTVSLKKREKSLIGLSEELIAFLKRRFR